MQETWARSPSWEYPLEKGVTTHSSLLAWEIPWTEEPGEPICRAEVEMQMYTMNVWAQWRGRGGMNLEVGIAMCKIVIDS